MLLKFIPSRKDVPIHSYSLCHNASLSGNGVFMLEAVFLTNPWLIIFLEGENESLRLHIYQSHSVTHLWSPLCTCCGSVCIIILYFCITSVHCHFKAKSTTIIYETFGSSHKYELQGPVWSIMERPIKRSRGSPIWLLVSRHEKTQKLKGSFALILSLAN